jgi:hypothetical protein
MSSAKPNVICPVVLGKRRVMPKLAASTWTDVFEGDVNLTVIVPFHSFAPSAFVAGFGERL